MKSGTSEEGTGEVVGLERGHGAGGLRGSGIEARVMVVDNAAMSRREAAMCIRRLGFSVECVRSGLQARRLIMERSYSVVLLDLDCLHPGEESPIDVAREADIPTVFVLLRSHRDQRLPAPRSSRSHETDMAGIVDKPWTPAELSEVLQRAAAVADRRARVRAGMEPDAVEGVALLLEDEPGIARRTRAQLERLSIVSQVVHTTSLTAALELPNLPGLAFALVDLQLEDARGLDAVRALGASAPDLPIVVFSASSLDLAEQALLVGAQEVVHKGADDETLARAVRRARLRKQADRKMRYRASHDGLTGLYNAAHFRERIQQCMTRIQRDNTACAVLYLDLDGFKPVNDRYGHAAGDQVLQTVAGRLLEAIRSCDVAARLGGDEFALLLEDVYDHKVVRRVAQRVLRSVSTPIMLASGEADVRVTTSVGIALCPQAGTSPEGLLHAADTAMLSAKRAGNSQYCFAREHGEPPAAPRSRLLGEIRQAVQDGEFYLVYQPQMDIRTRKVVGLEALLRWRRADGRVVGPDEFVPLLEELELINTVGAFVMKEACRHAQAWSARRNRAVRMAVNVSPLQLEDPDFVTMVRTILDQHGLTPERLELEVTEGTLMRQDARSRETLRQLRAIGVRIALDDFGTGYAALSYLREFALDVIKIDRSFVTPLATDHRARVLVGAIIGLARQLGMQVLAEGVETPHQLAYLREHGCDACQGYLFGRPHYTGHIRDLLH